jgi:hypothetical protein
MNDHSDSGLDDKSDEDILTYTTSDEAIEAAAGMWRGAQSFNCGSVLPPATYPCATC